MVPLRRLACALAVMLVASGSQGDARPRNPCRFTEKDVIGDWILPAPESDVVENDAREFAFEREGEGRFFREYLHHRPMGDGTWRFDRASCTLTLDYGGYADTLRVKVERKPHLVDEGGQIYRKFTGTAA